MLKILLCKECNKRVYRNVRCNYCGSLERYTDDSENSTKIKILLLIGLASIMCITATYMIKEKKSSFENYSVMNQVSVAIKKIIP